MSNMYPKTKTWNPFVGCLFNCVYCEKSFKRQLKRVARKIGCKACDNYEPHYHPERLEKITSAETVFVLGTGDISFCHPNFIKKITDSIDEHKPRLKKEYYFQSKDPYCFNLYLKWFRANIDKVTLLTTLETNRDEGYKEISQSPPPKRRFNNFLNLDYPKKVVTIEPVLDFDHDEFLNMILQLRDRGSLNYVWFGFDSKNCGLPEPSEEKAQAFVDAMKTHGVEVRGKTLRGVTI